MTGLFRRLMAGWVKDLQHRVTCWLRRTGLSLEAADSGPE
jgi:hypothetical protein